MQIQRITDTSGKKLKDAMAVVNQQAQNLHEEFSSELQLT
jgi:hypothetical protein